MTMELEVTTSLTRRFEKIRTSGELDTALSRNCDIIGDEGSSSTAKTNGCDCSIGSRRNAKRRRRTGQMVPLFDVSAGNDVMVEEGEEGMKLEWHVSSPSRQVSAASSFLRERYFNGRAHAHPFDLRLRAVSPNVTCASYYFAQIYAIDTSLVVSAMCGAAVYEYSWRSRQRLAHVCG